MNKSKLNRLLSLVLVVAMIFSFYVPTLADETPISEGKTVQFWVYTYSEETGSNGVEGVSVIIDHETSETVDPPKTDANGNVTISVDGLAEGNHSYKLTKEGYIETTGFFNLIYGGYCPLIIAVDPNYQPPEEPPVTEHIWVNDESRQSEYVAPTCTEQGMQPEICTKCNATRETPIPATGHNKIQDPDRKNVDATCISEGHKYFICTNCQATFDQIIPTDGSLHKWVDDTNRAEEKKAPTCTTAGMNPEICEYCRTKRDVPLAALGHSWDEGEVTPPTYTADGYTTYTCTVCGATETETIPMLATGHLEPITETGVVDESGENITVSGAVLDWYPADETIGRNTEGWWVGVYVVAPASVTEENIGNVKYANNADDKPEKPFAADGKNVDGLYQMGCWLPVNPDFLSTALSRNTVLQWTYRFDWDGDGEVDQTFTMNVDPKNVTLNRENKIFAKTEDGKLTWNEFRHLDEYHVWSEWTVTKEATCFEKGSRTRTCTICEWPQTEDIPTVEHTWGTNVDYVFATDYKSCTATRCCTVEGCGAKDEVTSEAITFTTTATCTVGGITTYVADFSDVEWAMSTVKASAPVGPLGHDWDEWYVSEYPTSTEKGEMKRDCKRCDVFETKEIAALGEGHLDPITATGVVEGNTITVSGATLEWFPKNESIGRYSDGWWIGMKIVAPEFINEDNVSSVRYYNDGKGEIIKNFGTNRDGDFWMGCWKFIDAVTLDNALKNGASPTVYVFDWNGDGSYDQTFTFTFDPDNFTLLNEDGSINAKTENGVFTWKDSKHLNHKWGEWEITYPTSTEAGKRVRTCQNELCGYTETETIPALGRGELEEITEYGTVDGDTITVVNATLEWFPQDDSIGRYMDGWWVGVRIIAPEYVTDDNFDNVWYSNDESLSKSFEKTNDGKTEDGRYFINCWVPVKTEYIETALKNDSMLTWKYNFDWDGSKTIDQTFKIVVNPNNITLNKEGKVYTQTKEGKFVWKNGEHQYDFHVWNNEHIYYEFETDYSECTATHYCKICGEGETITSIGVKVIPAPAATCTTSGITEYVYSFDQAWAMTPTQRVYAPALGHDMGEWKVVTPPTSTEKGEERSYCSRCDYYETREIDPIGEGYLVGITEKYTITKNDITVSDATLNWSPKDESIGRNNDGWWAGMKIVAPAYVTAENVGEVRYSNDGTDNLIKNFGTANDGTIADGSYWMGCWKFVDAAALENAIKNGASTTIYKFDWNGDGYVDQTFTFTIDPNNITLLNEDGSIFARTEDGVLTWNNSEHLNHKWGEWTTTIYPTSTEKGEEKRECSICHKIETREIAPIGAGYLEGITNTFVIDKDTITVSDATLSWSPEDLTIGRTPNGCWAGMKIFAPSFINTDELASKVRYSNNGSDELIKNFGTNRDGDFWMGCWMLVTTADLENAIANNSMLTKTYKFDWDGNGTIDQTFIFNVDPNNITLLDENGKTYTQTVDGEFIWKNGEHLKHNWVAGEVVDPTCTADGYTEYSCPDCGATKQDDVVKALGHAWVAGEVTAPTCTEKGYTAYSCSRCDATKNDDYTNALGHDMGEWYVTIAPTCTKDGEERSDCSRCDYFETRVAEATDHNWDDEHVIYKFSDGYTKCTATHFCLNDCGDTEEVEARYIESVETKAPSCTETGIRTHTATFRPEWAGTYTETEEIPMVAHTEEIIPGKAPTCTETGLTEGKKCSVCGEILVAQETIPALGHDYVAVVTAPTCTEKGYTTYTCSRCGDRYVDTYVDALGHTPGEAVRENEKPATCSAEGSYDEVVYCTVCGTQLSRETKTIEKLAHTPGEAVRENEKPATCSAEGSYDEVVYCTVCNSEISRTPKTIEKLAHTPGEAVRENEKPATCAEEGSYDEVVYCTVCNTEISRETKTIEKLAHTPGEAVRENEVPATYTAEGSYDEVVYCVVCGAEISRETKTIPVLTAPYVPVTPVTPVTPVEPEPEQPTPFEDVADDDYFHDPVYWAVENGVTDGMTDTAFGSYIGCTRAHIVTFLWRLAGSPEPETTENPFTDVVEGSFYAKAVQWAIEQGVTDGTSDTTFSPDLIVTRAQAVTFLWRYAGRPAAEGDMPFEDVEAGAYYEQAVLWAVANGITDGMSDTTFVPHIDCTRAQVVTFLYRAFAD